MLIKKTRISFFIVAVVAFSSFYYIYDPYIKTDIFRMLAKGSYGISSDNDTIYSYGYYGIRQYLILPDNKLKLINQNNDFCHHRIIGSAGITDATNVYVATRSFMAGEDSNGHNGSLVILDKKTLNIRQIIESDIKYTKILYSDGLLYIAGLGGFDIYKILDNDSLLMKKKYRSSSYKEYQGFDYYQIGKAKKLVFSLFSDGLEVWDVTDPVNPMKEMNIPFTNDCGLQSLDVHVSYPFFISTVAPMKSSINTDCDTRGIIITDISNPDSISQKIYTIPRRDWYHKMGGDPQPSFIQKYKDCIYVNMFEKGIAIFDVADIKNPVYRGFSPCTSDGALIRPIHITNEGILLVGCWYRGDIYVNKVLSNGLIKWQ